MTRIHALIVSLFLGAASVACAQTKDSANAPKPVAAAQATRTPAAAPPESQWLKYDAATNTITFKLEAGTPAAKSPFNFDGYTDGEATLVVPPRARVVMNFVNEDGTPHSAQIIADREPMPNMAGDPAIPGAYTRDVTQGVPQFGKDVIRFTAPDSGDYRIFCGVPGHGLSGMWIRFKIDPNAKTASFETGKK